MRMCIAELMQAAELLPDDDVAVLDVNGAHVGRQNEIE